METSSLKIRQAEISHAFGGYLGIFRSLWVNIENYASHQMHFFLLLLQIFLLLSLKFVHILQTFLAF